MLSNSWARNPHDASNERVHPYERVKPVLAEEEDEKFIGKEDSPTDGAPTPAQPLPVINVPQRTSG